MRMFIKFTNFTNVHKNFTERQKVHKSMKFVHDMATLARHPILLEELAINIPFSDTSLAMYLASIAGQTPKTTRKNKKNIFLQPSGQV